MIYKNRYNFSDSAGKVLDCVRIKSKLQRISVRKTTFGFYCIEMHLDWIKLNRELGKTIYENFVFGARNSTLKKAKGILGVDF